MATLEAGGPATAGFLARVWGTFRKAEAMCSVKEVRSLKVPGVALVAARAVREVVAAEGAAVVVAGHATPRTRVRVVHERLRGSDLPPLRRTGPQSVAVAAAQVFARVLGVAEAHAVGRRPFRRPTVAADEVARAARGDVAPGVLRPRRVALVAGRVRREPRRDRERRAAPLGAVTRRAVRRRPRAGARVARVVEPDVEAPQRRKRLDRAGRRVRMTDLAERTRRVGELLCVAARARRVPGGADWPRSVVFAAVAEETREARVLLVGVSEP